MAQDPPFNFEALRPTIERLMAIGGTPGLSLGVIHKGSPIYQATYGIRDTEAKLPITDETILPFFSLTKAVTSAALGILVEDKKATWDTLVKDALPAFESTDPILQECTTITDLLCHRTGIAWADNLIVGTDHNLLISGKDIQKFINNQARLLPFRGQFAYSNIAFELAGRVIESLSGESYFNFVQSRIFKPLGMDRTFLTTPPSSIDNVGKCYNALEDATVAPITPCRAGDDWVGGPSAGMRTCVRDAMKLYKAFLTSFNDQLATGNTSTAGSPLKQVAYLMSAKIPIDQPSRLEASYALGWARVQLPARMGQIGINPDLMPGGMPIVGKGAPSQLVIFHQGSQPGALALVMLLPDTESAVVVSSNSLALNDVPDWVGQLVLEELIRVPHSLRNDYVKAAEISAAENIKWYPALLKELADAQKNGTSPRDLTAYWGTYWDPLHVFKIVVVLEHGNLYWLLQGLETERFPLRHYEDDTFIWLRPREELSRRGRWVGSDQGPSFWKVEFRAGALGVVDRLLWAHDTGVPAVEYTKE